MKKVNKFVLYLGLIILMIGSVLTSRPLVSHAATTVNANAAFAIDAQTGQVLYNKNGDQRLAVASMSKLLTVAVIEHEIDRGNLKWSTKVKITAAEAKLSTASGYSNVPLKAGHSYTVKQLTEAALIKSGDAATIALTRAEGKSTKQFVSQMNAMAKRIGLTNYRFYNGIGLENKDMASFKLANTAGSAENQMTARDVAKLAQYLIKNYPDLLNITKQKTLKWSGQTYQNLNELLPGNANATKKITVDGLKTGTSDKAGQCLVSTGTYHGHRLIVVVMHADNRFTQSKVIYSAVFSQWQPTSAKLSKTVKVSRGRVKTVRVQTKQKVTVWQPRSKKASAQWIANRKYRDGTQLKAPFKANTQVGKLRFNQLKKVNGHVLEFGVYSTRDVHRRGLFGWLASLF